LDLHPGLVTAAGAALTPNAALSPVGQEWYVTIDTSSLTAGKYYHLCVDLLGVAPPGCTVLKVFMSSLQASTQTIGLAAGQSVNFSCASACTTSSSVFLARNCSTGYLGPKTPATHLVATSGNLWSAVLQADALIGGFRYQMCIDMDGTGTLQTGPSQVVVYVSGVSRVFPNFLTDGEQQVLLECGQDVICRSSRVRLVRGSCNSNTSDASEWHSITQGVNGSFLSISTDGLLAGGHYVLCIEMEPESASFLANATRDVGDSGFTLFVSPLQDFAPQVLLSGQKQVLALNCSSSANCTSKTQGFLSENCGFGGPLASEITAFGGTAAAELQDDTTAEWQLQLDTSALVPGQHYKLCLDMDGVSTALLPGQSSATQIFISPVVPAAVQTVKIIQDQSIAMQCVPGAACSTASVWYLTNGSCGEPLDASLHTQPMSSVQAFGHLAGGQGYIWMAKFNGQQLEAGVHYRVCLDLDGAGPFWPGDTGLEVYACGILSLAPAQILISSMETLELTCAAGGCPSGAMVWLASECDSPLTSNQPLVSTAGTATSASVVFETTFLPAGRLELCSDLDGAGALRLGSTGLYVYISSILAINDPWMQTWVGRLVVDCATSACNGGEAEHYFHDFCFALRTSGTFELFG